jgi:type I restriction enzyme S subunit
VVGFSDREEKRLRCPDGGLIVFGDHTCFVKFIDFDFVVGADGTQILQGKAGQSTRFHALQLQYRGVEPTGYNRHFKFVKERHFVVPPLSEQTAIVAVLSDMDAELAALEARHNKTRDVKQAMMQELLTGKTRLAPAGGALA